MNTRSRAKSSSVVNRARHQAGFTLMETMISLALSMVVTSAMVVLMGNSLGTTTRIIQMTQLTDELRNTMSMLTRDIRRANYSANAAYCYANSDCGLGIDADATGDNQATQWGDIDTSVAGCVRFALDRSGPDDVPDGDATNDPMGAFRLRELVQGGDLIGVIEMYVVDTAAAPDCLAATGTNGWVAVTDPDFVDITEFVVSDDDSFTGSIAGEAGATITQRSRQIQVQLEGQLLRDDTISRRIEDTIKVRNDMITKT
jgi:Tfp pilus assembly protein PilW